MSIQSEITRIKNNVDAAYDAVEGLGGTLPQDQTVANLLAAIASIKGIDTIQPSVHQGSISAQINRIATDIANAYRLCENSGATMPQFEISGNLAACISTIPIGWTWGDEDAEADSNWFSELQTFLTRYGADSSWVGKQKSVTLSSAVLGTTTHKIRCIGVNQDGANTVTFQTSNALAQTTVFGKNQNWPSSTARTQCINYYNACPAKDYIKTVSKGLAAYNSSRNGAVTYYDETVWLPSEREMGLDTYASISTANSTVEKAECTYGYNESYSYYTSKARRAKKKGDNGSTVSYWERSRSYYSSDKSVVCCIVANAVYSDASGSNYTNSFGLAPAFVIGAIPFEWGDEEGEADEIWFASLKNYLRNNPGDEEWVGKTKSVTLTSEVAGTTTHKIVCIGVNLDADNTATFQTLNGLATATRFSVLGGAQEEWIDGSNYYHSSNKIYDGNSSGLCKQYYDNFPGKASIKAVSKGTCTIMTPDCDGTATYEDQYVWIPSEGEVGLDSLSSLKYSNWTTSNGECTQGKKFQYPYYNSNARRVKRKGDSGSGDSDSTDNWWLRSHYHGVSTTTAEWADVCLIASDQYQWAAGRATSAAYYTSHSFAPAFVIGN